MMDRSTRACVRPCSDSFVRSSFVQSNYSMRNDFAKTDQTTFHTLVRNNYKDNVAVTLEDEMHVPFACIPAVLIVA